MSGRQSNYRSSPRNSYRGSGFQQQPPPPVQKNFVSGGQMQPGKNPTVVTYSTSAPGQQQKTVDPKPQQQLQKQQSGTTVTQQNLVPVPTAGATVQQKLQAAAATPLPADDVDMKVETGDNTSMETEENGKSGKPHWMRKKLGKRKPNKALVQRRLRKYLAPKNAAVALQELRPGCVYKFTNATPPAGVFTAEVEVDGKNYTGVGANKSLARAAAAEMALQSFVKAPVKKQDESTGAETTEDETPWSALASFALHKLFCDWQRGVVGAPVSIQGAGAAATMQPAAAAAAASPANFASDTVPANFQSFTMPGAQSARALRPPPYLLLLSAPAAQHTSEQNLKSSTTKKPAPKARQPRTLPEDAAKRHPVQLLNEMRPDVTFDLTAEQMPGPGVTVSSFTMTATLDGQKYSKTSRTKKLAKYEVAKAVMEKVFGVVYE